MCTNLAKREYKCNICLKSYASYKSLWFHNYKFHKTTTVDNIINSQELTNISHDIGHEIAIESHEIDSENPDNNIKKFICRYCNKIYKHKKTKWSHEQICPNKILNNTNKPVNDIIVPVEKSAVTIIDNNIDDDIKFNIKTYKNKYSITDVVLQCNLSVYPNKYISKIKDKILYKSEYYVTKTKLLAILEASKSIKGKKLLNEITLWATPTRTLQVRLNKYNQLNNINEDNIMGYAHKNPIGSVIDDNNIIDYVHKDPIGLVEDNNIIDNKNNCFYFNNKPIKYFNYDNNIYFKGKDIADILDYANTEQVIKNHIDDEDKKSVISFLMDGESPSLGPLNYKGHNNLNKHLQIHAIAGEDPKTIFINESGLYSLIMSSKKPEAKKFKRWVTSEVLPSIRKTGSYYNETNNFNNDNNNNNNDNIFNNNYIEENLDKYNNKDCIYILHIKDNLYKFGKSSHLKNRLNIHKRKLKYIDIVKIHICQNMNIMTDIENLIKELIKKYQIHTNYNNQTEIFEVNNDISLEKIMNKINKIVNTNNNLLIEDIKIDTLTTTISTLESDNNYHKQNKLLELKNIALIEKTKQIEINANIKIEQEKTKQVLEKTKQLELEYKTMQLKLELYKLSGKII